MKEAVFFDLFQTLVKYDPPREEIIAGALNDFDIDADAAMLVQPIVAADEFIYQAMANRRGPAVRRRTFRLYVRHHEKLFRKPDWSFPAISSRKSSRKPVPHTNSSCSTIYAGLRGTR
jgi:hypothetical protein